MMGAGTTVSSALAATRSRGAAGSDPVALAEPNRGSTICHDASAHTSEAGTAPTMPGQPNPASQVSQT